MKPLQILGKRKMVLIGSVGFDGGEDSVFRDEAGDVVYVSVSVIARAAAVEPDGLVDAEVVVEGLLQLFARDAWVALLHFGQEALFGGEEDPCAVGVDGAAL